MQNGVEFETNQNRPEKNNIFFQNQRAEEVEWFLIWILKISWNKISCSAINFCSKRWNSVRQCLKQCNRILYEINVDLPGLQILITLNWIQILWIHAQKLLFFANRDRTLGSSVQKNRSCVKKRIKIMLKKFDGNLQNPQKLLKFFIDITNDVFWMSTKLYWRIKQHSTHFSSMFSLKLRQNLKTKGVICTLSANRIEIKFIATWLVKN